MDGAAGLQLANHLADLEIVNWRRFPLAKAAGLVLLVGWLPLLVYIPFDMLRGGGGNPIGLGLLVVASNVTALVLLGAQALVSLARHLRGRSGGAA